MSSIISGTNIVMSKTDPVYGVIPMACAKAGSFNSTMSLRNVTNAASNNFDEYKPNLNGWSMSSSGFIIASNYSFNLMLTDWKARTKVFINFSVNAGTDGFFVYSGYAYIESINISGPYNDNATFDITFRGTGAVTISGVNPSPNIAAVYDTDYTAVGGETFITISALIGKTILNLFRGGPRCGAILPPGSPGPTGNDIIFNPSTGRIDFDPTNPLTFNEYIAVNYK